MSVARSNKGALALITPGTLYYLALFALPLVLLATYSFYSVKNLNPQPDFILDNYVKALTSEVFRGFYLRTFRVAFTVACIVLAIAFPFVFLVVFVFRQRKEWLYFFVLVSLFGGYIVRVYAWRNILGKQGILNESLISMGIISEPLTFLLNSEFAVVLALVNYLLPFGILPIYSAMQNVSPSLIEASRDLGASRWRAAVQVVLPLASRGCMAAFLVCFIGSAAEWVTPQLLGGTGDQLIGNQIQFQFGGGLNWPLGAALAITLVLLVSVIMGLCYLAVRRWLR